MGMGNVPWHEMGQHALHFTCVLSHLMPWDISHETDGTEIDEQDIENLLSKNSDSKYVCQNENEL